MSEETLARFWSYVIKTDSCWPWMGTLSKPYIGYGGFTYKYKTYRAHRIAYETVNGAIPAGLVIDHVCRNPPCVNPDHLEAVTNFENVLRGVGISALNAQKTHCELGHELAGENLAIRKTAKAYASHRICRTCERARAKMRKWRLKGFEITFEEALEKWHKYNSPRARKGLNHD